MTINIQKATYSIPEAMELLGLSRQTIYNIINSGELTTYTVGRRRFVSSRAISDFIRRRETSPGTLPPAA